MAVHGARTPIPLTILIYILIITTIIVVVIVVVAVVVVVIVGVGKKAAEEGGVEPKPLIDCEGISCKEVGGKDHLGGEGEGEEAGEAEGRKREKERKTQENYKKKGRRKEREKCGNQTLFPITINVNFFTLHGFWNTHSIVHHSYLAKEQPIHVCCVWE